MVGASWKTDEQGELVEEHMETYIKATNDGKKAIKRFWDVFNGVWFARYSELKILVNSGELGDRVLAEGYDMDEKEANIYKKAMESRKAQIKTLFRYAHKKVKGKQKTHREVTHVAEGVKEPSTAASKTFATKQRRVHNRAEMFYVLNKDWLDPLISTEMEKVAAGDRDVTNKEEVRGDGEEGSDVEGSIAKAEGGEGKGRGWNLIIRGEVIKSHYEAASEAEKERVSEALIREKEKIKWENDLYQSGRALARDFDLRKDALDRVHNFMVSNGKLAWEQAAMTTLTVGVAPDPDVPGKMRSRIVAYGRDASGKTFTDFDPAFGKSVLQHVRAWARRHVFTPENYALHQEEKKECLAKLVKGEGEGEGEGEDADERGDCGFIVDEDDVEQGLKSDAVDADSEDIVILGAPVPSQKTKSEELSTNQAPRNSPDSKQMKLKKASSTSQSQPSTPGTKAASQDPGNASSSLRTTPTSLSTTITPPANPLSNEGRQDTPNIVTTPITLPPILAAKGSTPIPTATSGAISTGAATPLNHTSIPPVGHTPRPRPRPRPVPVQQSKQVPSAAIPTREGGAATSIPPPTEENLPVAAIGVPYPPVSNTSGTGQSAPSFPQPPPAPHTSGALQGPFPVFQPPHSSQNSPQTLVPPRPFLPESTRIPPPAGGPTEPIEAGLERGGHLTAHPDQRGSAAEDPSTYVDPNRNPTTTQDPHSNDIDSNGQPVGGKAPKGDGVKEERTTELGDGIDVGEESSREGESDHGRDEDDEYDSGGDVDPDADPLGEKQFLWAKFQTNIPATPTGPSKEGGKEVKAKATAPKKKGGPKRKGGVKKRGGAKGKKTTPTAANTNTDAGAPEPEPDGDSATAPGPATKPPRKRKVPPPPDAPLTEGRSKRVRTKVTLPDGTTFSGATRSTRA